MKLYEPVSIILGILLFGSVISDKINDWQDRKQLKFAIDTSVGLSKEVVTLSANNIEATKQINTLLEEKGKVEEKYNKQLAEKDKKTGEQMGLLAAQAKDIAQTTPASDTIKHFDTAKQFMDLYSGSILDSGLAWNTTYINSTSREFEALKKELEITKKENDKLTQNLQRESEKAITLSTQLNSKSIELEKTVGKVQVIENTLYNEKGWAAKLKKILFISALLTIIGGILYVGFHIWHVYKKNKDINDIREKLREEAERRRQAMKEKFENEAHAKELTSAVKTFLTVDSEGNETMRRIIAANGLKKKFEGFVDCDGNGIDDKTENKV